MTNQYFRQARGYVALVAVDFILAAGHGCYIWPPGSSRSSIKQKSSFLVQSR